MMLWVLWVAITLALMAWSWLLGWWAGQAKVIVNAGPAPSQSDPPAPEEP